MWIMTTAGFYSAVQKGSDPTVLTVRTRARDAANIAVDTLLTEFGEECEVTAGGGTDYPYRFEVSRENFALWLAHEARNYVDYSNFKSATTAAHGKDSGYVDALHDTWTAMLKATDDEGHKHGITGAWKNPHYADWSDN